MSVMRARAVWTGPLAGTVLAALMFALIAGPVQAAASAAAASSGSSAAEERLRIAQERAQVRAEADARERGCALRFDVTPCVEDAHTARRQAEDALRQRELRLDDADRQQRASQRAAAVERKRTEALSRAASAPPASASAASAPSAPKQAPRAANVRSAPSASAGTGHKNAPKPPREPDRAAQASEAALAASRAEAGAQRREAAALHRAEVERRNAERAASGKGAAPLPLPAPLPPARVGSAP